MKPKHLLTILPLIALLTGCGEDVKMSGNEAPKLAGTALTATPMELVIYPNDRPSIPDGKPIFEHNCASCHGQDGLSGKQGVNVKFDETWAHQIKPVDIYRMVTFGGPNHQHPAFNGKLNPRELWNVVVYCRSLGQPALTDAQIAAILPVFGANCAVCHGVKGDGDGPLSRNLEPSPANFQRFDRFFNRTDDVLFDHIANGIRWEGMPNFLGKQTAVPGAKEKVKFDETYIRKLVQFVHKFHVGNAPVYTADAGASSGSKEPKPEGAANANGGSLTSTSTGTATSEGSAIGGATGNPSTGATVNGADAKPKASTKAADQPDADDKADDKVPANNNNSTNNAGTAGH